MAFVRYGIFFTTLFLMFFKCIRGDQCDDQGHDRGRSCSQFKFNDWEIDIKDVTDDDGRLPRTGDRGNKNKLWRLKTQIWCESIRPCPNTDGVASVSSNIEKAAEIFRKSRQWRSVTLNSSDISTGQVWVSVTYPGGVRTVGAFHFQSRDVTRFEFEASQDGDSWVRLDVVEENMQTSAPSEAPSRRHFKVKDRGAYRHYRLLVTGAVWGGDLSNVTGSVEIGDFGLCLYDDQESRDDDNYVMSPPFLKHQTFASSSWGRSWVEKFAFRGQSYSWSSRWVEATNGWLNEPQHIGVEFIEKRIARRISFMTTWQSYYKLDHPMTFVLQGSDDGTTWLDLLAKRLDSTFLSIHHVEELSVPEENHFPFKKFRLYVNQTGWSYQGIGGRYVQLRNFKLC